RPGPTPGNVPSEEGTRPLRANGAPPSCESRHGRAHGPIRGARPRRNGHNGSVSEQPEHYFSEQPAVDDRERTVVFELDGVRHELTASTGVFSGNRLDPGTSVLLHKVVPPESAGTFLDLGCGYGPISAVLAQREDAEVWRSEEHTSELQSREKIVCRLLLEKK